MRITYNKVNIRKIIKRIAITANTCLINIIYIATLFILILAIEDCFV